MSEIHSNHGFTFIRGGADISNNPVVQKPEGISISTLSVDIDAKRLRGLIGIYTMLYEAQICVGDPKLTYLPLRRKNLSNLHNLLEDIDAIRGMVDNLYSGNKLTLKRKIEQREQVENGDSIIEITSEASDTNEVMRIGEIDLHHLDQLLSLTHLRGVESGGAMYCLPECLNEGVTLVLQRHQSKEIKGYRSPLEKLFYKSIGRVGQALAAFGRINFLLLSLALQSF